MSKEFRIAIIALVSGVIFYYGFNFLKGSDFLSRTEYYYAVYNNIGSLTKSNPVKINGVPVGKVNRVTLLPNSDNKVLVEFDVQENILLGDSTIAELTSDLLGGTSIVLRIATVSGPLEPGDTLISIIDKGLEEIIDSAQPVANNLNIAINRLNDLLAEFAGIGEQLQGRLRSLDTTLVTVNAMLLDNQSNINEILAKTNTTMTNVNERVSQLGSLLTKANTAMDSVDVAAIGNILEEVEGLTSQLNEMTAKINNGEGSIGKMMTNDSLYNNLNQTLVDLDKLLIHFDQYPKDFLKPLGRKHKKLKGK